MADYFNSSSEPPPEYQATNPVTHESLGSFSTQADAARAADAAAQWSYYQQRQAEAAAREAELATTRGYGPLPPAQPGPPAPPGPAQMRTNPIGRLVVVGLVVVAVVCGGVYALSRYLGSGQPAASTTAALPADAIVGDWRSDNGLVYEVAAGKESTFSGQIVGTSGPCGLPVLTVTWQGQGRYSGTAPLVSSCPPPGYAPLTIQVAPDGRTAEFTSSGCSNCGPQRWVRSK